MTQVKELKQRVAINNNKINWKKLWKRITDTEPTNHSFLQQQAR